MFFSSMLILVVREFVGLTHLQVRTTLQYGLIAALFGYHRTTATLQSIYAKQLTIKHNVDMWVDNVFQQVK